MLKELLSAALDLIFPPLCHICRRFIPDAGELHICHSCRETMPTIHAPLCPVCGVPFAGSCDSHPCGSCCTSPPHFDAARAPLAYDGAARDLVHAFKYRGRTHLRRPLGLLMVEGLAEVLRTEAPELVMPVPLHRKKLASRGFNQALLLAEVIGSRCNIPLQRHNLRRIRWTEPQIDLPAGDRRANVKGAFALRAPHTVIGRRVLVVDDVLTTGSTAEECARVLKTAGAVRVSVATAARALHH